MKLLFTLGMKQENMRLILICILLVVGTLTGCGEGEFEATNGRSSTDNYQSGTFLPDPEDVEFFDELDPELSEDLEETDFPVDVITYEEQVGIRFKSIAKTFELALGKLKEKIWIKNCSEVGSSKDNRSASKQYRCGELPIGDIVDESKKRLIQFEVKGQNGSSSGVSYNIDPTSLSIYMDRNQYRSHSTLSLINSKKETDIQVQSKLFGDIYFKNTPHDGVLFTSVCTYLPGGRIFTDIIEVEGSFKKKLWIFSLKGRSYTTIDAGSFSYDHVKACALLSTQIADSGRLEVKVVSISKPEFENPKMTGLKTSVRTDASGLLSVINSVTKIFGLNIERSISEKVKEQIDELVGEQFEKLENGDIETGKWIEKYFNSKAVQLKVVDNLNESLKEELASHGPGQSLEFKLNMESLCLGIGEDLGMGREHLIDLCRHSFSIAVKPFITSEEHSELGCYEHYVNSRDRLVLDKSLSWWSEKCSIENRVTIKVPPIMARLYSCFTGLMGQVDDVVGGICHGEIQRLKERFDQGELDRLIERAKQIRDRIFSEEREEKIRKKWEEFADKYDL